MGKPCRTSESQQHKQGKTAGIGTPLPSFSNSAHKIEQKQDLEWPCHLTWASCTTWHWQPLLSSTSTPCRISAVFFFLTSPTIFLFIDLALLHSYPGLSSKVFRINVPNFWHALHKLSAICIIFFITYKTNKTQKYDQIYQLFEINLGRIRWKIHAHRAWIIVECPHFNSKFETFMWLHAKLTNLHRNHI